MEKCPPIWSVAANVVNNQSRTVDKVWSSNMGVRRCAENFSSQKLALLRNINMCLKHGIIFCYELNNGKGHGLRYMDTLLSKDLKITIYRNIILSVVLHGYETWSLTLKEERRLRVYEKRVLRRIYDPKKDKGNRRVE
jgi:hypothetical protein